MQNKQQEAMKATKEAERLRARLGQTATSAAPGLDPAPGPLDLFLFFSRPALRLPTRNGRLSGRQT